MTLFIVLGVRNLTANANYAQQTSTMLLFLPPLLFGAWHFNW